MLSLFHGSIQDMMASVGAVIFFQYISGPTGHDFCGGGVFVIPITGYYHYYYCVCSVCVCVCVCE